jgi:hypothetical protein
MLMEFEAREVNQLKVVLDRDKGNNLTLCTSFIPTSLT